MFESKNKASCISKLLIAGENSYQEDVKYFVT